MQTNFINLQKQIINFILLIDLMKNLLPKIEDFLNEIEIAIDKVFEIQSLSPQEKNLN